MTWQTDLELLADICAQVHCGEYSSRWAAGAAKEGDTAKAARHLEHLRHELAGGYSVAMWNDLDELAERLNHLETHAMRLRHEVRGIDLSDDPDYQAPPLESLDPRTATTDTEPPPRDKGWNEPLESLTSDREPVLSSERDNREPEVTPRPHRYPTAADLMDTMLASVRQRRAKP